MRKHLFIAILLFFLINCRNKREILQIDNLDLKTQFISVDSVELSLFYESKEILNERFKYLDENMIAENLKIDKKKQDWICDLQKIDLQNLFSNRFLKFQESIFKFLISNYSTLNNADFEKIFFRLNKNILKYEKNNVLELEKHFAYKIQKNDISNCRKDNQILLFSYLKNKTFNKNKTVFCYKYKIDSLKFDNQIPSSPFIEMDIIQEKNKTEVWLKYLYFTNLNYSI